MSHNQKDGVYIFCYDKTKKEKKTFVLDFACLSVGTAEVLCFKCVKFYPHFLLVLLREMREKLERITKWLTNSGMKVNDGKTELCLFHRKDQPPVTITVNNQILKSKPHMNVLGVTFNSKLNWQEHISKTVVKSKKSLQAISIIKKHFDQNELKQIVTSNYYSILYYNSEIWHLPTLTRPTKQLLISASSAPLKICTHLYDLSMSFDTLHTITKRASPPQMMKYRLALQLNDLYNNVTMSND